MGRWKLAGVYERIEAVDDELGTGEAENACLDREQRCCRQEQISKVHVEYVEILLASDELVLIRFNFEWMD